MKPHLFTPSVAAAQRILAHAEHVDLSELTVYGNLVPLDELESTRAKIYGGEVTGLPCVTYKLRLQLALSILSLLGVPSYWGQFWYMFVQSKINHPHPLLLLQFSTSHTT